MKQKENNFWESLVYFLIGTAIITIIGYVSYQFVDGYNHF